MAKKTLMLLVVLYFSAVRFSHALDPTTPLSQYILKHWDNRTGLPQNSISAIAQTTDGYMWFGTQIGLARFDGVRFEQFLPARHPSMIDGYIIAMASGRDGSLWFQTPKGIQRYFRGRFEPPILPGDARTVGLHGKMIESHDGAVWAIRATGISRWKDGIGRTWGPADGLSGVNSLTEDEAGRIWISTPSAVYWWVNDRFVRRDIDLKGGQISDLTSSGKTVVISVPPLGILRVDARTGAVQGETQPPAGEQFGAWIVSDRRGMIWTYDHTRALLRTDGNRSEVLNNASPLSSVFEDREGTVWLGGFSGGLTQLSDTLVQSLGVQEGLPSNTVWSLDEDRDGSLWIGSQARLSRYRHGKLEIQPPFVRARSAAMAWSAQGLLVGTERGLYRLGPTGARLLRANVSVSAISRQEDGSYLIDEDKLRLWDDVHARAKIESGKLDLERSPFRLDQCIEEALDLLSPGAGGKGLDLIYWLDDGVPLTVWGDVTRLRQILINLVGNGVKFTKAGEVAVCVTARPLDGNRSELQFSVRDTGIGIPEDRIHCLFQSFSQVDTSTTRNYGGTGLGLAISRRLCELMNGRIWVESTVGVGSDFRFVVQVGVDSQPEESGQRIVLAGERILVVDDNATNRKILTRHLSKYGAYPHSVESGEQALEILASGMQFDLALLDQQMPGLDGVRLAEEIRAHPLGRELKLILLSSSPSVESEPALFNAVLTKPLKPRRLLDVIIHTFGGAARPEPGKVTDFDWHLADRVPLRILVAEDNSVNQRLALRLLEKMGYRADLAGNGVEVLESLRRQPYDLVLMDVQMPEMDGLEATRRIRREWVHGPRIVAMTANVIQGDREACLAAGMDDYVSKPIQLASLHSALLRC